MYSKWQLATKYLRYYLTAANGKGHGTHSPFIFQFITKVMGDRQDYPEYDKVETLRRQLQKDQTLLAIEDMGAGSSINKTKERTIASIARHAAKPARFGQLLFRMVKYYQPSAILELGTSLGITTSYLSLAKPGAKIITLEGAPAVADKARQNFNSLQLSNVSLVEGNFDDTLLPAIQKLSTVDFCFVDGNHRREPTERYFHQLLPALHNDSILVFDDIHWSAEMEAAWETIRRHPSVTCSVDMFFIGVIFLRKEIREKQEFVIRF
jgi:predicted O-methyltransferase YrrM